jgi:hypothetical protein
MSRSQKLARVTRESHIGSIPPRWSRSGFRRRLPEVSAVALDPVFPALRETWSRWERCGLGKRCIGYSRFSLRPSLPRVCPFTFVSL